MLGVTITLAAAFLGVARMDDSVSAAEVARTCDQLPKNYFVGHFSSDGGAPANDTVGVELCIPEGNPNNMPAYAQMFVSNEQGYLIDVGGKSLPTSGTRVELNTLVRGGEVCSLIFLHSYGEPAAYAF